jgi:hypothetical protein
VRAVAVFAPVATTTSTRTLIQLQAPTSREIVIHELAVSFSGIDNLAVPIEVQLLRQVDAGTASSLSIAKSDDSDVHTVQSSAQEAFTVEPTAGSIVRSWFVHPQSGIVYQPVAGQTLTMQGGDRLGVRVVTPDVSVAAVGYIEFAE